MLRPVHRDRPKGFGDLTVIVPTWNEAATMPALLRRVSDGYPGATVVVADDDSTDGTREVALAFDGPIRVRILHRAGRERGLTASVVDALATVDTPHFVVIDADLQHPPEAVGDVLRVAENGADLAVGAREGHDSFGTGRRAVAIGARMLARSYLRARGKPLVSDPMSGFFGGKTAFAQAVIAEHGNEFEKPGFKVLLDLLRFAPEGARVEEVRYRMGSRAAGESKLRVRHVSSLLRQLGPAGRVAAFVLQSVASAAFWKFATVGLSGVLVNQGLLFLGHGLAGLPLVLASALAIETAIVWNFHWNDRWAFRDRGRGVPWPRRLGRFNSHCLFGAAANAGVLWALVALGGVHYLVANLVGIGIAMSWNWALSHRWTWGTNRDPPRGSR